MKICPLCGVEYEGDICPTCGYKEEKKEESEKPKKKTRAKKQETVEISPENVEEEKVEEKKEYVCPACGMTFEEEVSICPNCKHDFSKKGKTCPSCEKEVDPLALFCDNCGYSFVDGDKKKNKNGSISSKQFTLVSLCAICLCVVFTLIACFSLFKTLQYKDAVKSRNDSISRLNERIDGLKETIDALKYDYEIDDSLFSYSREGNVITMGEYPQTIASSSAVEKMGKYPDKDGYYTSTHDNGKYVKIIASPKDNAYKFTDGSTITGGSAYYFKVEPLKWTVIKEVTGKVTVISNSIIDMSQFYRYAETTERVIDDNLEKVYANNWQHSDVRYYLNNVFIKEAFNILQRSIIEISDVKNDVGSGHLNNAQLYPHLNQNNTFDKIYLLSYQEMLMAQDVFALNRYSVATDYSRARGVMILTDETLYGNGYYWLRSPDIESNVISTVCEFGTIHDKYYVSRNFMGIRPVLTIDTTILN